MMNMMQSLVQVVVSEEGLSLCSIILSHAVLLLSCIPMPVSLYRSNKEVPSTQLSPVKKRVKESSPPRLDVFGREETLAVDWSHVASAGADQRHSIVINDSPSPPDHQTPVIITISSDESDGEQEPSANYGDGSRQRR